MNPAATIAALLLLATIGGRHAQAQPSQPSEYEVKAAFLYNFARFVEWPEEDQAGPTFTICIVGEDPFGEAFESIEGRQVRGRTLVVDRRPELGGQACDMLFISSSERRRMGAILAALEARPILTVSEVDGFGSQGGMINFVLEQREVRFEISIEAVERAGLEMSAKLLRVARVAKD